MSATARYSTFARNQAGERGGAVATIARDEDAEAETIFDSTILWDNDAPESLAVLNNIDTPYEAFAKSRFSHSLIQGSGGSGSSGGFWDIDDHGNGSYDDGNNVDADPLFEYHGFSNGGRVETVAFYSDQSAAFNGGDEDSCPDTDARGKPRPARGGCDIGAFEYQLSDKGPLIFNDRFESANP